MDVRKDNTTKFNQTLNNMVKFVLIQKDGTKSIRKLIQKKFGFSNPKEMLEWIKKEKNCSIEKAREVITTNLVLLKIMFIIA